MKISCLILLAAIASVSGKKEDDDLPPQPTMEFVHHLTLSDSKVCGDGETVHIECGLNIMQRLPIPEELEDEKKDKDKEDPPNAAGGGLRRRLKKEDDEPKEPELLPPLFSSDIYEMEITNCTNSVKGQNRTMELAGRQLIVEAEGFQNIDVASVDPYNNTETIMTRQGRMKFWERPTELQQLMGYQKSDHIGNLLFKVVVERKKIIDQTEMFVGMTLTMQAMADAIMMNDTGVMFPEPVPAYKNYTQVISAELDWERMENVVCSPKKFVTAMPTPQPTQSVVPSMEPSMEPSANPSLSLVPSKMPSSAPTPLPSITPSTIPSSAPSTLPSDLPSTVPSTVPSALPSTLPSPEPSSLPTALPSPAPSPLPTALPSSVPSPLPTSGPTAGPTTTDYDPQGPDNNAANPDFTGTVPSRQSPYDGPMDQDNLGEFTREYYGTMGEAHDTEKPDLIIP
ncbi:unnamed protein product [Cylindrotheca closterium]|uniref:PAS domain-containing protein n=1 Tax=Cylindrotheca closterium TaxID=2856 RepID=A0AAD2G3T1_9STRA|nr:unnamed protein product [Cylindrotheca closterium]